MEYLTILGTQRLQNDISLTFSLDIGELLTVHSVINGNNHDALISGKRRTVKVWDSGRAEREAAPMNPEENRQALRRHV